MAQFIKLTGKSGNPVRLMNDKGQCYIGKPGKQMGQTIWKPQPIEVWEKALDLVGN